MGRYISWDDVSGRYQDAAKKALATNMGSYWLERAEHEIDGYLGAKFTVPFSPAPPIVQDLCVDLTYYKLIIQQKESKPVWDYIKYRLDAILAGNMVLVSSGSLVSGGTAAWSQADGQSTSFGPDDPVNWQISSSWMDAVQTERDLD